VTVPFGWALLYLSVKTGTERSCKNLDEIGESLGLESDVDADKGKVCGMEVPTKDELIEAAKKKIPWNKE